MAEFKAIKKGNRVGFGSVWEERFGYSRAIRVGDTVYVGGMTATDNDGKILARDLYGQMKVIYQKMEIALQAHGASLHDVVKEVIYCRDFSDWEGMERAHRETFGEIRPVSTGIAIADLLTPEMLIEIDATAIIGNMT